MKKKFLSLILTFLSVGTAALLPSNAEGPNTTSSVQIQENPPLKKAFRRTRVPFSYKEDKQLIELVNKYGHDWCLIGRKMKKRSAVKYRERYLNFLAPNIEKTEWSEEELELLAKLYNEGQRTIKQLQSSFPTRSYINIRNRLEWLKRRAKKCAKNRMQLISESRLDACLHHKPITPPESPEPTLSSLPSISEMCLDDD